MANGVVPPDVIVDPNDPRLPINQAPPPPTIDFQPAAPAQPPPPPPQTTTAPPPAAIDFQPAQAPVQPSAVSVETSIPRYSPAQQAVIDRIKSGRQDYTFGPGSPGATKEDLETFVGGKHSPAGGFAVHGGVALAPSEYNLFTPEQRRQLGIMDVAPEDQRGQIERYYAAGQARGSTFLAQRLVGGAADRGAASSIDNLNPDFTGRLEALLKAAPGDVKITSGYRSEQLQKELYDRWVAGGKRGAEVAPPGHSQHGRGMAVDLSGGDGFLSADSEAGKWIHAHAAEYGLRFPMGNEPWHIEPIEARTGGAAAGSVQLAGGPEIRQRIGEAIAEPGTLIAAKGAGLPTGYKPPPPVKGPTWKPTAVPAAPAEVDTSGYAKAQPVAPGEVTPVIGPAHGAIDFQPLPGQTPVPAPGAPIVAPGGLDFQPAGGPALGLPGAAVMEPPGVAPPLLAAPEGPFPRAVPVVPPQLTAELPFAAQPAPTYPTPEGVAPPVALDFQPLAPQLTPDQQAAAAGEEFRVSTGARAPLYPEGSPEHAAIMRAHAGDLSRPPGIFARQSTIEEAVAAGLPRVVPGDLRAPSETEAERLGAVPAQPTQLTEAERLGAVPAPGPATAGPMAPPGTEPRTIAEAFNQGGILGALFGDLPVAKISPELLGVVAHHYMPNASAAVTQMEKLFPATKPAVEGLTASAAETLTGLTTPSNVLILGAMMLAPEIGLPAWISRAASLGFSAQAAHGMWENAKQLTEQPGTAEWWKSFGNVVVQGAFAATAGMHGFKGAGAALKPAEFQRTTAIADLRRQLERGNITMDQYKARLGVVEGRPPEAPPAEAPAAAPPAKTVPAGEAAPPAEPEAPAAEKPKAAPAVPLVQDESIPANTRYRMQDQLKAAGLSDQEIATISTADAQARLAQPAARIPTPTQRPAPTTPPLVLTAEPALPADLRGAKPRYNYGSKAFELEFESDLDKASYIAAQATKSRADARYVKFAMDATGLSEAEIRKRGQEVRQRIKSQAATAEPGTLRIAREGPAPEPGAPPVSEKPAARPDVAGTASDAINAKIKAAPEISKQIDAIVRRGAERKAAAKDPAIVAQRPTEYDWLTGDELARIERLKAKLPTAGEQRVAAQARVKAKRAARLRDETAAETKARLEHEREMQEQLGTAGSEEGPELVESVIAGGGLPAKGSKARAVWKGELDSLEEAVDQAIKDGRLPPGIKKKLFRADAPDLDRLATSLRDYGFEAARDTDVIDLVERRLATDRPHYGQPARAAAEYGMGAAHINEPLASYEQRAFGERLQQDKSLADKIRENVGTYYEPISNKATLEEAVAEVDKMTINRAVDQVMHNERLPFHVRSAMGQLLIKRLNLAAETLRAAGDNVRADRVLDQAVDLAGWAEEFGTRLGQGVQSFAMWQRLTPEGQLRSVEKKVNEARRNYTEEHKREIAELKAKILELQKQQLTDTERLAELKKLFGRNPTAKRVKPYLQKLLDATRSGKFTDEIFYNIVSERLGLPKFDRQTATQIMRLAFDVAKAPEGLPKDKATLALQHYIATRMGFAPKDLPLGIWYGNMLSGYNTQLVNTVDTLVNVLAETTGLAMTNPRAMGKIYYNLLRGLSEGKADALVMWNNGRMRGTAGKYLEMPALMEVAQFGQKGGVPIIAKGPITRAMKAAAESKVAYPLNAWKYVGRLMMASDSIMFRGARQAKAAALADRAGRQEGLSGKALDRRVREMLGQTAEQYQDFAEQAKREGFTGAERAARIMELRDRVQSAGATADAEDFAGVATYNHAPRGLLGKVATMAGQFGNIFPPFKLIVPFTRIVANVTNRSLNYSPWGFKRALYGYTFDKSPMIADERAMHFTRAAMGTSAMFGALALQSAGVIEIHGNGPKDPERRRQQMQAGWKPYSIKIGDHYVSYLPTPLAITFGILGNMSDSFRYHEMDSKHGMTAAVYALARTANVITSQSFLSGLSNFFNMVSAQPDQAVASWRNYVAQTASSVFPRIALDIERIFDPTKYDSNTLTEDLMRNTPFATITNKPSLNAFGETTSLPRQRFVSAISKDLAWQIVNAQQLRVPTPDKYTKVPDGRGGLRQLTPEEYYDMLEETGPKVKQWILSHSILENVEPADAQARLDKAAEEIRRPVLDRIKRSARWNPVD